jgi:hypothetical protein
VERVTGAPDDVVLSARGERLDDRLQVAGFLGPVVAVHERVHLRSRDLSCVRLPSSHRCSFLR